MWAYGLRYSEGRGGSAQAGDKAQRRGRSKSVMTPCLAFSKSIMVEFWSSCHEFVLRKIEALPEVTIMVNSYHLGLKKWITITLHCNTFFGQGNQIKHNFWEWQLESTIWFLACHEHRYMLVVPIKTFVLLHLLFAHYLLSVYFKRITFFFYMFSLILLYSHFFLLFN